MRFDEPIEEGYDVVATDDSDTAKSYLRLLLKPRLVIVDLQDLPSAEALRPATVADIVTKASKLLRRSTTND